MNGSSFISQQAKAAREQDDELKQNDTSVQLCGVHDGKMYLMVMLSFSKEFHSSSIASILRSVNRQVQAVVTYDFNTGEVKRCEDETIKNLVEDVPLHYDVGMQICGDLMLIGVDTTKKDLLPVPEGYYDDEDALLNDPPQKIEEGERIIYVYHLPSKKIIKEWTKPYGTEEKLIINPDQTFLMMEKQEDGTYRCTEYNQSCEETVSFVMEEGVSLEKYQDSYYYEKYELIDDTMKKIGDLTQYNIKTGKTTAFPMKESMGMNAIIGDVMLVSGSPDGSPMRGLVDMSCFDTGELEIRPIQGMI